MQIFESFSSQILIFFLLAHPDLYSSHFNQFLQVKTAESAVRGKTVCSLFVFLNHDFSVMIETRPAEIPPLKYCTVMCIGTPGTAEMMHT